MLSDKQLATLIDKATRNEARSRAIHEQDQRYLAFLLGERDRRAKEAAELALTNTQQERSMLGSKMELHATAPRKNVKIAAKMSSDSAAKKALLEAGITASDAAKLLGVGHSTVNAWCTGARSIPRHHADKLRSKHRIPVAVWPKLAD